jgi:hypothetical protein
MELFKRKRKGVLYVIGGKERDYIRNLQQQRDAAQGALDGALKGIFNREKMPLEAVIDLRELVIKAATTSP